MPLAPDSKQKLDQGVRHAFQTALEKYGIPPILDHPQFQDFANQVVNNLYDALDRVSLSETLAHYGKNQPTDPLLPADQVTQEPSPAPNLSPHLAPTDVNTPRPTQPPSQTPSSTAPMVGKPFLGDHASNSGIPLAPDISNQLHRNGTQPTSHISPSSSLSPTVGAPSIDQRLTNQGSQTPERGGLTRGINALRYRRPLQRIERQRTITLKKQKNLQSHYKKLQRQARTLRLLLSALKRSLNIIWIVELLFYIIGGLLCVTIIGIKLGVPLIAITNRYAAVLKKPLNLQINRVENNLEGINKKIKATKYGLRLLQNQLAKLANQERQLRNASLLNFTRTAATSAA